jgi:TUP1-like enhancer of split
LACRCAIVRAAARNPLSNAALYGQFSVWLCLAVTGMRLSAAGLPLAVLSNGTAHAYHAGMAAWMKVADALFPTSAFHSVLRLPSGTLPPVPFSVT